MLHVPNMLLIGAAGRDAGKTVFACELVRRFHHLPVLAVKATVIQERGGDCPRGGAGCGVCAALDDAWRLTEETCQDGPKDTQRLLAAGAERVFWLRVLKAHLEAGARALLDRLGPGMPFICESNSLRLAVEPGLFLLVRHADNDAVKESARTVRRYADAEICSDGRSFDFDFERVAWTGTRWRLRP